MRTPAVALSALALVAAATLTACTPQSGVVVPDPEPSNTPLFASDEEALAAAEEAYAAYLAASDAVSHEGGADPSLTQEFVTQSFQDELEKGLAVYLERGWHTEGASSYDTISLQQWVPEGSTVSVVFYVCADVSAVRILDSSGSDVTPQEREERLPLEVEAVSEGGGPLLIERSDVWPDASYCSQS